MTVSRALRLLEIAAVAVLVAGVACLFVVERAPRALVVDSSAREGWQTIEYEGVRVDIPDKWARSDVNDCEFRFERWAPPDAPACAGVAGVNFYASSTFDAARGPGVKRDEDGWAGYVYAGDYAVYVMAPDRDLVAEILDTAHPRRKS